MLDYLKRCHASVADQEGVSLEHIVMDGCSTDGTAEWLASTPSLVGVVAPDEGMYDAINKGFRLARGDVLCDVAAGLSSSYVIDVALDLDAAAQRPDVAAFHCNLAEAYRGLGLYDRAVSCCRIALGLKPDYAEAATNLGLSLLGDGPADVLRPCQ